MSLNMVGQANARVEDMRFQELSSSVEVPAEDYDDYAKVIARSLSSGHDAISQKVMDFMKKAAYEPLTTVTSSFAPFEFKVGSGGDVERIVIELTVKKDGADFHVTSKKIRNCNLKAGHNPQSHQATGINEVANREISRADNHNEDRFNGYYSALSSSLAKGSLGINRTRSHCDYFTGASPSEEESANRACRICFETRCPLDNSDDLVNPCNCSSPVHVQCLRRWQQVQIDQAAQTSREAAAAKAATCEICGALLCLDGARMKPPMRTAICRPDALEPVANDGGAIKKNHESRGGKVPLRRFPASTHAAHVFAGSSVEGGQALEVLEQDTSGEFFRVRVLNATRYQDPQGHTVTNSPVAVAQGWIQHVYLEFPDEFQSWAPAVSHPVNPPCKPARLLMI